MTGGMRVLRTVTGWRRCSAGSAAATDHASNICILDVRDELVRDGAVFALARVKQDLLVRLQAFGLTDKIGADKLFPTLPTAVDAYRRWAADQERGRGEEPGGSRESA